MYVFTGHAQYNIFIYLKRRTNEVQILCNLDTRKHAFTILTQCLCTNEFTHTRTCTYIILHIYIFIHIYTHTLICTHTQTHAPHTTHTHIHSRKNTHTHTNKQTNTHSHIYTHLLHNDAQAHSHTKLTNARVRIHTHKSTYIHSYTDLM